METRSADGRLGVGFFCSRGFEDPYLWNLVRVAGTHRKKSGGGFKGRELAIGTAVQLRRGKTRG